MSRTTARKPTSTSAITNGTRPCTLTKENNYTTGRIYHSVITKERRGDYLGGTVQVVPHVTDEIKQCIMRISQGMDVDDRGDRRHGRRYRELALPRSHSSDAVRRRPARTCSISI